VVGRLEASGVRRAPDATVGKAGAVVGRCLNGASRCLRGVESSPDARTDEVDAGSRIAQLADRWTGRTL
jgi:hypothetical protein